MDRFLFLVSLLMVLLVLKIVRCFLPNQKDYYAENKKKIHQLQKKWGIK